MKSHQFQAITFGHVKFVTMIYFIPLITVADPKKESKEKNTAEGSGDTGKQH